MVLANPDREWSLSELARRVGASVATVQREIARAEEAGVVRTRKVGNTRLVRADEHGALTRPLTDLLERALGPKQLLSDALSTVPGVEAAFLFGSWAARYSGDRGPAPNDIDVLVIGEPDRGALDDAIAPVELRLAHPIQVTVRRREWWESGSDSFRREIAQRPIVELIGLPDGKPPA